MAETCSFSPQCPQSAPRCKDGEDQEFLSCASIFTDTWNLHFNPQAPLAERQKFAWSRPSITHLTAVFCDDWRTGWPNTNTKAVESTDDREHRKRRPTLRTRSFSERRSMREQSAITSASDERDCVGTAAGVRLMTSSHQKRQNRRIGRHPDHNVHHWRALPTSSIPPSRSESNFSGGGGTATPSTCCSSPKTPIVAWSIPADILWSPDTEWPESIPLDKDETSTCTSTGRGSPKATATEHWSTPALDGLGLDYWAYFLEISGSFDGVSSFASGDVHHNHREN